MDAEDQRAGGNASGDLAAPPSIEPLLATLAGADEPERYRWLANLLAGLAKQSHGEGKARAGVPAEEIESLSKKVKALSEEKANVVDKLATTKADLDHHSRQLEAEQTRAHELQLIAEEQRGRLEAAQKKVQEIETKLEARNTEIHKAHLEIDDLTLKLQRSEGKGQDQSRLNKLEDDKRGLANEVQSLRAELEQLRVDKGAEIARLNEQMAAAGSGTPDESAVDFPALWKHLASTKPPLVDGHVSPTVQAAERLMDTFIELVQFVDDFDQLIRPFLTQYVRDHPPVRVPWDVYAKRDGARDTIMQIIAPVGGKPPGILRVKLRGLYKWIEAAMIGCDAAIESVASELESFTRRQEAFGMGSDPNRKIREFIRESGPDLFLQHIRELRGSKIAEVFGRTR